MKSRQSQSLSGVIRQRLAAIEERLSVGVRQKVIVAELAAEGYETTLKNLRNELCRARKRSLNSLAAQTAGGNGTTANLPSSTESQAAYTPREEKTTENLLKKPTGFNYGGTKDITLDDLI